MPDRTGILGYTLPQHKGGSLCANRYTYSGSSSLSPSSPQLGGSQMFSPKVEAVVVALTCKDILEGTEPMFSHTSGLIPIRANGQLQHERQYESVHRQGGNCRSVQTVRCTKAALKDMRDENYRQEKCRTLLNSDLSSDKKSWGTDWIDYLYCWRSSRILTAFVVATFSSIYTSSCLSITRLRSFTIA